MEIRISALTGSVSIQTSEKTNVGHRAKGNPFQAAANQFTHHVQASLGSDSGQYLGSGNKTPNLTCLYPGQGHPPVPRLQMCAVCMRDHYKNIQQEQKDSFVHTL